MTESKYLSSTNPAAMRTLLVERGLWTERKCRAFVEACRNGTSVGAIMPHFAGWTATADWWGMNAPSASLNGVSHTARAAIIRDIWGNPWREVYLRSGSGSDYWTRPRDGEGYFRTDMLPGNAIRFNPDWLTFRNGLVPELAKAAVTRECECDGGYVSFPEMGGVTTQSCGRCHGRGTTPITGHIDPLRLAVLADALEEAGCADDGILGHLRQTTEKCPNMKDMDPRWLCCSASCQICKGTGSRPVSHVWTPSGGCWVVDLLLGSEKCGPAAVGQPPAHDRG